MLFLPFMWRPAQFSSNSWGPGYVYTTSEAAKILGTTCAISSSGFWLGCLWHLSEMRTMSVVRLSTSLYCSMLHPPTVQLGSTQHSYSLQLREACLNPSLYVIPISSSFRTLNFIPCTGEVNNISFRNSDMDLTMSTQTINYYAAQPYSDGHRSRRRLHLRSVFEDSRMLNVRWR